MMRTHRDLKEMFRCGQRSMSELGFVKLAFAIGVTVLYSLIYLSILPDTLSAAMPTAVSTFK